MSEPLNEAWRQINAQGGVGEHEYDHGYVAAINDALAIIEKLGGRDPAISMIVPKTLCSVCHMEMPLSGCDREGCSLRFHHNRRPSGRRGRRGGVRGMTHEEELRAGQELSDLERENEALTAQRDALAEALRDLLPVAKHFEEQSRAQQGGGRGYVVFNKADAALATLEDDK